MPRSNRPSRRRGSFEPNDEFDPARVLFGTRRTVPKRDGIWNVQPLAPTSAQKTYLCPGCGQDIGPGTGHVVTWRADGLFGEEYDLAARRHWHDHCWKIRP